MSLLNYVKNFALNYTWSDPNGAMNVIIKANKLSSISGNIASVPLPYTEVYLPNQNRLFFLLELGKVDPAFLELDPPPYNWTSINSFINNTQTMLIGFCQGRFITIEGSYIRFTDNGNCYIAIDYVYNSKIILLNDSIYIRFYTNPLYNGTLFNSNTAILTNSFINISNNISNYLTFCNYVNNLTSTTNIDLLIFKNGLYLPSGLPSYNSLQIGDILEYLLDPLLINITTGTIANLPIYNSTLDSANKLIVSSNLLENEVYVSDIEVFIFGYKQDGTSIGAYFPRLSPEFIRMLTFKDWGIHADNLANRLLELQNFTDVNQTLTNIKVSVYRRNNGKTKRLLQDSSYIPDLMNLPATVRTQILTGVNSNATIWNAATLEASAFNNWIGLDTSVVETASFNNILSRYSAISLYDNVQLLPNSADWSLSQIGNGLGGILQSYGTNGYGVVFTTYLVSTISSTTFQNGRGYEMYFPVSDLTSSLDRVIAAGNTSNTTIQTDFGIFCYYLNGSTLEVAEYGPNYTIVDNGDGTSIVIWNSNVTSYQRFIRSSRSSVIFTISLSQSQIYVGFDIYNGRAKSYDVGMENCYIWANGIYLTEGLDYTIINGLCYITSKINAWSDPITITVIYTGLPNNSLSHTPSGQWGWVQHGIILSDGKYDLLANRNYLFFVAGRAVLLEELHVKENYLDVNNITNVIPFVDGQPFAIVPKAQFSSDVILNTICSTLTYDQAIDTNLSAFLSTVNPIPQNTSFVTIATKYVLVSTLINKLIDDIVNGIYIVTEPSGYYGPEITAIETQYATYLSVDPCTKSMDLNYVEIIPRWTTGTVNLTVAQFNLILAVNSILLGNQVSGLNLYVNVITS